MGLDIEGVGSIAEREDEGVEVVIIDPRTGEGSATVQVVGTYSPTYRREWDAQTQGLMRKRRQAKPTSAEVEQQQAELVAACIKRWNGFLLGGQPYLFTREHAVDLLVKAPFIREQLEFAMKDHERFFSNGSASSSPAPGTPAG